MNKTTFTPQIKLFSGFTANCICFRPKTHVICKCGFQIFGRVQTLCPRHPKTIFLIDLYQCPCCKGFDFMEEVSEYN